ncbi:unnamed protein product, partial [Sphagnum compactum]
MESLFNFNIPLDIQFLDGLVRALFQGEGSEQQNAQRMITQFQEHPDSWQRVDFIIENSKNQQTKFLALQILDKLVQTKWNVLPKAHCDGIKSFIVSVIIRNSSTEESLKSERLLLSKLNMILVQILKKDWPKKWPTFISEIVGASRSNMYLCENNMMILKLLSEEIFDYSAEQMTTVKVKNLKHQLNQEFSEIFQLCSEVLFKGQKASLLLATLEALLRFLKWIPLGYIFETNLTDTLRQRFLSNVYFRNVALSCFTEIGGLIVEQEYDMKFVSIFHSVMDSISSMIPYDNSLDLVKHFAEATDNDQKFIQNLSLFFTSILSNHLKIIEEKGNRDALILAHLYLLKISLIDDREIFKICLEYWNKLVGFILMYFKVLDLYNEIPPAYVQSPMLLGSVIPSTSRRNIYSQIVSSLRHVMISRMVKPEEVLIVEDDNGEIVREFIKETDTITLYKSMRECLVLLTHLDCEDTEIIMTEKLAKQ